MARVFDLPPDGLVDGAVAKEVVVDEAVNDNPSGMKVSIRPKLAVNVMRVELNTDIIDELNQHIDDVFIPAKDDDSIFGFIRNFLN